MIKYCWCCMHQNAKWRLFRWGKPIEFYMCNKCKEWFQPPSWKRIIDFISGYKWHAISGEQNLTEIDLRLQISDHEAARKEWEAKEKALRELANEWASFSWAPFMNPAARLKAILSEQKKQP